MKIVDYEKDKPKLNQTLSEFEVHKQKLYELEQLVRQILKQYPLKKS